jgi:hypothetical protein
LFAADAAAADAAAAAMPPCRRHCFQLSPSLPRCRFSPPALAASAEFILRRASAAQLRLMMPPRCHRWLMSFILRRHADDMPPDIITKPPALTLLPLRRFRQPLLTLRHAIRHY